MDLSVKIKYDYYEWMMYSRGDMYNRVDINWPCVDVMHSLKEGVDPDNHAVGGLTGEFERPDADVPIYDYWTTGNGVKCISPGLQKTLHLICEPGSLLCVPLKAVERVTRINMPPMFLLFCTVVISKFDLQMALKQLEVPLPAALDRKIFRPKTDRGTIIVRGDVKKELERGGFSNLGFEKQRYY